MLVQKRSRRLIFIVSTTLKVLKLLYSDLSLSTSGSVVITQPPRHDCSMAGTVGWQCPDLAPGALSCACPSGGHGGAGASLTASVVRRRVLPSPPKSVTKPASCSSTVGYGTHLNVDFLKNTVVLSAPPGGTERMGEGRWGGRRVGRREVTNQNCCWLWVVVPGEVNAREGSGRLAGLTVAVGLCGGVLALAPHCSSRPYFRERRGSGFGAPCREGRKSVEGPSLLIPPELF